MKKIFDTIQMSKPRRSAFDLSHERKLSMEMGKLVPTLVQEVVPGDHFKGSTEIMARMAPMVAPVMHRVNVFMHYFFVPNRIIWNQWEDFITGGREGTTTPTMPVITLTENQRKVGSLPDHLGVPTHDTIIPENDMKVNALPFWAYHQIYNDYYRDPNLSTPHGLSTAGSYNTALHDRAWEKDYFTSALPWAQRGPEVNLPIAPNYAQITQIESAVLGNNPTPSQLETQADGHILATYPEGRVASKVKNLDDNMANLTINDLRRTSALQRWLEKQARGGYRYVETILSHFGVKSSDQRLQRAEYIGGGKQPMVISEVLNTSSTATDPQGTMSGHGISTGSTNNFKYKVEEHGYIIGICSILPRTAYQQGLPRHFVRRDKTDFYWPEFANLGEQEVKRNELYWTEDDEDTTFGYQQRYAEYKYAHDTVHGDFKDTLNFWHMGRIFETPPNLNENFVKSNPTDRIFAVEEGDKIWVQLYNDIKAQRPMPYFADPRLS